MVGDTNPWARSLLCAVLAGVALLGFAAPVLATPVAGENGRIVLSSGRNLGETARELFLLPVPSSTGGGTLSAPIASVANQHHRHPTWSPDRTKIAYARGTAGAPPFDIFVQDLTAPLSGSNPVNITTSGGVSEDRPAWSPDGRHIAWENDQNGAREIVVALPNGGGQQNITNTAGVFEGKPAWSPDSDTIFYEDGNAFGPNPASDIAGRSISGTAPGLVLGTPADAVPDSGISEMQPAISPDGTKICFTLRNSAAGNSSGEVVVASLANPASQSIVSFDLANADYNCTFSPDSTLVAYVTGTGANAAQVVMVRADDTSPSPIPLANDPGSDNFDGNPDWAPDARPECPESTVEVTSGESVSIPVECTDTGPAYERTNVREFITGQPQNGTAEQASAGDPITYTPNPAFLGTDTIEIGSFDELGFGSDRGKVTINVIGQLCDGTPATIGATEGDDTIQGTTGADVVAGLGGNDIIKGGNGKDLLCGGLGNDSLSGGKGKDRLFGNKGKDRLTGGKARDKCVGGPQKDRLRSCP